MEAVYYTVAQLAARGSGDIPRELVSSSHLIYSSPATLAFNSPGAEGYGVKRAGLAVPGSVMLIVSPGCCGRNTSAISRMPGYEDRFFYLTMDETDLVTGRHLKKIPDAVEELCRGLSETGRRPRAVMICITCVDALLGTDMERVCRRAQEKVPGVRVRPCYMYALTREGRKPPMVHVRQSIYELLEPRKKKASSVNLLGFFPPLSPESELPAVLSQAGVRTVRQIGACADFDAFQEMAEANFNLVLNPEARPAAYDLQKRLGIPFIELTRFYQIDRIEKQYAALGQVLQTSFDDLIWKKEAAAAAASFREENPDAVFSVGEGMNGNPFELACALVREGFAVREIFGTVSADSFVWIRLLASISPDTRVYSNLHPTMLYYGQRDGGRTDGPGDFAGEKNAPVTITIGRDAGWYHPDVPNVQWITDIQPFGYGAVTGLFRALGEAMKTGGRGSFSPDIALGEPESFSGKPAPASDKSAGTSRKSSVFSRITSENPGKAPEISGKPAAFSEETPVLSGREETAGGQAAGSHDLTGEIVEGNAGVRVDSFSSKQIRGFRRFTTPFAPDQSGAVSVLYDMGGISVICDAGGCTGNICGFDEPRWFESRSAVFSAGLRDMDAILGRDDRLVEKLAEAAKQIPARFAAVIGTPVPAVIGTDYRALCRMAEKKTGLPVLGISTDGMEFYDRGIEKTYLALLNTFCKKKKTADPDWSSCQTQADQKRIVGVWGFSPLDFSGVLSADELRAALREQGFDRILCPGAGTNVDDLAMITKAEKNLAVSPAGAAAVKWLETEYGTPWEYGIPGVETVSETVCGKIIGRCIDGDRKSSPRKVLVVHQQVLADRIRRDLGQAGISAEAAGFFMMGKDLLREGDTMLREEDDLRALILKKGFDCVIADRSLGPVLAGLPVRLVHLPHFAVSGDSRL